MLTGVDELFARQVAQQQNWYDPEHLTAEERETITKDLVLHLHEEIAKLQRRIARSPHHILQPEAPPEVDEIAHDVVDVFKLLVATATLHGVTPAMFMEQFERVTRVVDDKWKGQNLQLASTTEVLLCDLDGCVADWVRAFDAFALVRGVAIAPNGYNHPSLEPLKDEFDRSGGYLAIKPMPGAVETLKRVQAQGVKLIVVTARPYQRFRRVYSDTLEWCRREGIDYDHIFFLRDKAEAVRKVSPARIIGHIEDRAKHAIEVALAGVKVFKLPCEANEHVAHANIVEVTTWEQIWDHINARQR